MTGNTVQLYVFFAVILVAAGLYPVAVASDGTDAIRLSGAETTDTRNEDSTPRDAVLPVSPAIATPKDGSGLNADAVSLAKALLLQRGYDIGTLDVVPGARFRAALFEFQRSHGLAPSGQLDRATATALGVERR